MALSSIESALTHHIRLVLQTNFAARSLKIFAFVISLVSCACAGSVLLFSLFTPSFTSDLHYSQFQINIIGSFTSIGMYLPLPLLGYLADAHGPVLLSIISILFFTPGYTLASAVIVHNWSFWYLAVSFGFIGCATSALYFTALLTCAKINLGSKGLTISAPVTCYGLSSLIGSQLLKMSFLEKQVPGRSPSLDLAKCFKMFSYLYLFIGVFNWMSSSVVSIERDVILRTSEVSPLLTPSIDEDEDENDLVPDHKTKYMRFLKDHSAYILVISVLLNIGPSEMYITNMGSLITSISPRSSIPDQVSIHAIFSTVSRLTLGGLSDFLLAKYQISRNWLLLTIIILGSLTQFCIANSIFLNTHYGIISALSGFSYGGLFTLYPTIVLSIWGPEIFGSAWGSFMVAPAVGASSFGMLFAYTHESYCKASTLAVNNCLSLIFWLTTASFLMSGLLLVVVWKGIWNKRNLELF